MIVILSMHRSGSSLLTGLLAQNGIFAGEESDFIPAVDHNPTGFWELKEVNDLNEQLIARDGFSHLIPNPQETFTSDAESEEEIRRIGESLKAKGVRILKDPRFCLTLAAWENALPISQAVILVRHPLAVANSMKSRHNMPIQAGLALWEFYTRRSLGAAAKYPTKVVILEQLLEQPAQALADIISLFEDRTVELSEIQVGLLNRDLIHNKADSEVMLTSVQRQLWDDLCAHRLDAISREDSSETISTLRLVKHFKDRGYDPILGGLVSNEAREVIAELRDQLAQNYTAREDIEKHLNVLREQHNAMNQAVRSLDEPVIRVAELERADHAQRVERKLLEEFAAAVVVRPWTGAGAFGPALRCVRNERRAHALCVGDVGKHFIRLDLRQRFDTPAGLRLDLVDVAVEVVHVAAAGGHTHHCQHGQKDRPDAGSAHYYSASSSR